ncbi:hypothetical protein [Aliidiomarina celeris]|uniref:hypothetical protein n=1 Tax=Aliidiomarina celeris TaxID=2249428 RepID=UPI001300646E|nr:hypothetical protein [Aliidiomarina celeris]
MIETGSMSEAELSEYCRERGLFVEQVKAWKADSLKGFASSREQELNLRIKPKRRLRRDKPDALSVPTAMIQVRKSPPHKFFFAYLNSRFAALLGFTGVCYSAFVLQPTRLLG